MAVHSLSNLNICIASTPSPQTPINLPMTAQYSPTIPTVFGPTRPYLGPYRSRLELLLALFYPVWTFFGPYLTRYRFFAT